MVIDHLMERKASVPNLPVKRSVRVGKILNFDGDDGTCKVAF